MEKKSELYISSILIILVAVMIVWQGTEAAGIHFWNGWSGASEQGTSINDSTSTAGTSSQFMIASSGPARVTQKVLHPEPTPKRIYIPMPELPTSTYAGSKVGLKDKINALSAEIMKDPENLDKWVSLGLLKIEAADYPGAREALEYASSLDTTNKKSFVYLGELYYSKFKMYDTAESNWRQAIENDPANPTPYIGLYTLYFNYANKNLKSAALEVLNQGLAKNPDQPDLLFAKARYYNDIGDKADAKTFATAARDAAQKAHRTDIIPLIDAFLKQIS